MKHQLVKAHESMKGEKKSCPRCGVGTFLAKHKDRSYCGKCHYTEFSASK